MSVPSKHVVFLRVLTGEAFDADEVDAEAAFKAGADALEEVETLRARLTTLEAAAREHIACVGGPKEKVARAALKRALEQRP